MSVYHFLYAKAISVHLPNQLDFSVIWHSIEYHNTARDTQCQTSGSDQYLQRVFKYPDRHGLIRGCDVWNLWQVE